MHCFELLHWDAAYGTRWKSPGHLDEKGDITSWGVGQVTSWSHETHGCADALVFRVWLEVIPESEYASLVRFRLANPGVAAVIQAATWEQLWLLYNGGHPKWLPNFNGALERVADVPVPQATLISAPSPRADVLTRALVPWSGSFAHLVPTRKSM